MFIDWLQVLLLEAGGNPTIDSEVPELFPYFISTPLDWVYNTEPQPEACLGFQDERCNWPRGKLLGGCSATNGLIYMRGHRYHEGFLIYPLLSFTIMQYNV